MLEFCWILLQNFKLKYASNPHSHRIITCSNTTDLDLNKNATKYRDNHIHKDSVEIILHFINGKYWNMLTTGNRNKPVRAMVAYLWEEMWRQHASELFWTVKATLWRTICPLTKCDLLLIVFSRYNTMGQFHGWILQYHGRMPFTIPWVNSMGRWIIWVDEYHGLMPFSIRNAVITTKQCHDTVGSLTINNTFKNINYYAYRNTLFITKDYITDFLKTVLTEDTWTTASTDLASWLPRWCNLMKAAYWIYIVGSLQVSTCLQKSRNGHEDLSRA